MDALKQKKEANRRGARVVPGSAAPAVPRASTPPPSPKVVAAAPPARPDTVKHTAPEGSPDAVADGKTGEAPLYRFAPRPANPRLSDEYDPEKDDELAAFGSTLKQFGVLQPLTVCPIDVWLKHHPEDREKIGPDVWWIIIIGNRRYAIAKARGIETLSFVRNDGVGDAIQVKKTGLIENHHRKSLNPILEAMEIQDILEEQSGVSYRTLADELGFSHGLVWQRLQLLKLIGGFQALVAAKELSADKAWRLAKLSHEDQQKLLELGPPYSAARLREKDKDDEPAVGLVTRAAVKIPKKSPPAKVVDVLIDELPIDMVAEVSRLLVAKLENSAAV
ncbi:ParB/RepB/Spo0J family partition protein [Nocardia sp. CY41]|uniref:ParB/RepB/Spo0J family partition protein n=1 Tax=Nocardia sp. CY41 TaxID=2608686 RepID=UPI001356EA36|nr:ParB N-terminal domain-containing protein [Nocardia sp. CY41]